MDLWNVTVFLGSIAQHRHIAALDICIMCRLSYNDCFGIIEGHQEVLKELWTVEIIVVYFPNIFAAGGCKGLIKKLPQGDGRLNLEERNRIQTDGVCLIP